MTINLVDNAIKLPVSHNNK